MAGLSQTKLVKLWYFGQESMVSVILGMLALPTMAKLGILEKYIPNSFYPCIQFCGPQIFTCYKVRGITAGVFTNYKNKHARRTVNEICSALNQLDYRTNKNPVLPTCSLTKTWLLGPVPRRIPVTGVGVSQQA